MNAWQDDFLQRRKINVEAGLNLSYRQSRYKWRNKLGFISMAIAYKFWFEEIQKNKTKLTLATCHCKSGCFIIQSYRNDMVTSTVCTEADNLPALWISEPVHKVEVHS